MKRAIVLIFIFCVSICFAQQPIITKLDKKTVIGTLFGMRNYSDATHIIIKRNKRYLRSDYKMLAGANDFIEIRKGKWKIKNDTLVLTERFYKQRQRDVNGWLFYFFGKKTKRTTVAKLILYKGKWMEVEDNKYIATGVYTQYIQKGMTMKLKNAEEGD